MSLQLVGGLPTFSRPRKTIAFGTPITDLIQPHKKARTKITTLKYTASTTAHTLTLLRALAKTTITTAIAASGTAAILKRDPGAYAANYLADSGRGPNTIGVQAGGFPGMTPIVADNPISANDWLAIATANRDYFYLTKISAASVNADGTVNVTLSTAAPTGGIPAGAEVFFFGITTDTHPLTGEAHPAYSGTASVTTTVDGNGGEVMSSFGIGEPIMFNSDNATATGVLELITGVYGLQ